MFDKLLGEVKGVFNTITIFELIVSVLFILMGIIFFSSPGFSNVAVTILTGILLIVNGISSIFAFLKRGSIVLFNNNLIYGIVLIIIGIISFFFGKTLSIFIGIYFLIIGIQKMNYGFFLKKFNESSWILTGVVGILLIIIAIISFFTDGEEVVSVAGICLFGFGVFNFINILLLRRRSKYFIA